MVEYLPPEEIEKRSFEIIKSELSSELDPLLAPIIMRVIHTTADFEYIDNLTFSDNVVKRAVSALKDGVTIVSDTNMVKSGIDKSRLAAFGCDVQCFVADEDIVKFAKENNITRSKAAVDKAITMGKPIIFAIGNAPTALMRICELKDEFMPELVIGVPVGFVNVVESKEMLMNSGIPYITAQGRKGGSNVAAAICNALLRVAENS